MLSLQAKLRCICRCACSSEGPPHIGEVVFHLLSFPDVQLLPAESGTEVMVHEPPRACTGGMPDTGEFIEQQ